MHSERFSDKMGEIIRKRGFGAVRILVINCSPVRNGATAEIVRLVGLAVQEGNEVRSICIDDYHVSFCKGCRQCHETARCFQEDDVGAIVAQLAWADRIVAVSPSYWADIPGQFKAFIDRCTPWCNTHEPHATIPAGKKGYVIALRTGTSLPKCDRVISSIEHFYGHLEIRATAHLRLCAVACREDVSGRAEEIRAFCDVMMNS